MTDRVQRLTAEAVGTGLLLVVVVGSGINVERLSAYAGAQLGLHALAVGGGLAVLIAVFIGVSGAHFNPAVTFGFWRRRVIDTSTALAYGAAQLAGAVIGVGVAHVMYGEAVFAVAATNRFSGGAAAGELVGTFLLVLLILALVDRDRAAWIPVSVGAWVVAMILATPSGGLLNPAVTLARTLTDTYTGVAPVAAAGFVVVQLVAALTAVTLARNLLLTPELKGT